MLMAVAPATMVVLMVVQVVFLVVDMVDQEVPVEVV